MLPYFYQKEISLLQNTFNLTEQTNKHCIQVLRMKNGDQLKLTNGKGLVLIVEIIDANKKNSLVKIIDSIITNEPIVKNTIAISLLKNINRFEWFLEKATELGIAQIVPLICTRTEKENFKTDRLETIIISAMLQSQQNWLPILVAPIKFSDFVQNTNFSNKYIAHCENLNKIRVNKIEKNNENKIILIGPEGDFTPKEIELALQNNFIPISLGNTRLRTETAAVVAATFLQFNNI